MAGTASTTSSKGARWIVRELWGRELDAELDRWAYVGDSTNDQRMFAALRAQHRRGEHRALRAAARAPAALRHAGRARRRLRRSGTRHARRRTAWALTPALGGRRRQAIPLGDNELRALLLSSRPAGRVRPAASASVTQSIAGDLHAPGNAATVPPICAAQGTARPLLHSSPLRNTSMTTSYPDTRLLIDNEWCDAAQRQDARRASTRPPARRSARWRTPASPTSTARWPPRRRASRPGATFRPTSAPTIMRKAAGAGARARRRHRAAC